MSFSHHLLVARPTVSANHVEEETAGLYEFHALSDAPVTQPHDGVSPISVCAVDWRAQFNELWAALVPPRGRAATEQGEVIRLAGSIHAEFTGDGTVRDEHRDAADWLELRLDQDVRSPYNPIRLRKLLSDLRDGRVTMRDLDELVRYGVQWVLANPLPVAHAFVG